MSGDVLGYDLVLFRRAPPLDSEGRTLTVFLIETVGSSEGEWQRVIARRTVQGEEGGWQVFRLKDRLSTSELFCVQVHVRDNERGHLNRSLIREEFVLGDSVSSHEANKMPVFVKYIRRQLPPSGISPLVPSDDPFPFFRGGFGSDDGDGDSEDQRKRRSSDCAVHNHIVDLSDHFESEVAAPTSVDVGRCSRGRENGKVRDENDRSTTDEGVSAGECIATETEDLTVLLNYRDSLFMTAIPDAIVKKCGQLVVTGDI